MTPAIEQGSFDGDFGHIDVPPPPADWGSELMGVILQWGKMVDVWGNCISPFDLNIRRKGYPVLNEAIEHVCGPSGGHAGAVAQCVSKDRPHLPKQWYSNPE